MALRDLWATGKQSILLEQLPLLPTNPPLMADVFERNIDQSKVNPDRRLVRKDLSQIRNYTSLVHTIPLSKGLLMGALKYALNKDKVSNLTLWYCTNQI